jgi:putative transposase
MAKRQFILTKRESNELRRAEVEANNVQELRRLQAVRLYGEGKPVQEILNMVGGSWRSLMDWCQRYRAEGIAGLASKYQGQNAAKVTHQQRRELAEKLRQYRPDQVIPAEIRISQGKFWTISDLKIVVKEWYGVTYQSDTSYRNLLHTSRFSLQMPESRYRHRPDDLTVAEFEAEVEKK